MALRLLPLPVHQDEKADKLVIQNKVEKTTSFIATYTAPPYGHRRGWIPRTEEDFGDGGAFPEITVAQYPLDMGRPENKISSNALAVQLDAEGNVKYDVIARQGHTKDKVVYSKLSDTLPVLLAKEDDPTIQKPDEETLLENMEKTRLALEQLTSAKISAAMPIRAATKPVSKSYYIFLL